MKSISRKSRILAALLAAAAVFLPCIPAFAAETDTGALRVSGEIIEFLEPAPDAASMTVPLGTAVEDLNLPGDLAALVRPLEAATLSEPATEETATPSGPVTEEELDISVTWRAAPEYDAGVAGEYIFTAVVPQEYSLADGVEAPQVVVTVEGTEEANVPPATFAGPVSAAASLTGVSVTSDFPINPMQNVGVDNGKLTAEPIGGETDSTTYQWYTTDKTNIELTSQGVYSVKNSTTGTPIDGATSATLIVTKTQFNTHIFCIAKLGDVIMASNAFRAKSFPPGIGDLIVDYASNTITVPVKGADAELTAYGNYMDEFGLIGLPEIAEVKPTYDETNKLLKADFSGTGATIANLGSFQIEVGGDAYIGILRESSGRVPAGLVATYNSAIVITLSTETGPNAIPLTSDYVESVITKVKAVHSGKDVILVMRGTNTVTLNGTAMTKLATDGALSVGTDAAYMSVNKTLLGELAGENAAITLEAESTSLPDNTNADAMAALGSAPTVVDLSISAGSTPVSDFADGGAVTVSIPYTLGSGEDAADIVVYYVKDDGKTEAITGATYADGFVTFTTTHFSTFAVGYKSSGDTSMPPSTPAPTPTPTPTPTPSPTPVYSSNDDNDDEDSGSDSGGGDSNSRDRSTAATGPVNVTTAAANSAVNSALAAARASGAGTATARLVNPGDITMAALQAMAQQAGTTPLTVNADSIVGNAVDVRVTFNPAQATTAINLSASTVNAAAKSVTAHFERFFANDVMTVALGQQGSFGMPVQIAAKLASTLNTDNLVFYNYNRATNSYTRIAAPAHWIDANGYVHFTTTMGGSIIISDGAITRA